LRPFTRTSLNHQPEAQHPKSSTIHKLAGRLPHLSGEKRTSNPAPEMTRLTHSVTSPPSIDALRKVHSITSSASNCIEFETVRPSALAVLRLITNSNLVDCWTGKSAGLAPLRIFPV